MDNYDLVKQFHSKCLEDDVKEVKTILSLMREKGIDINSKYSGEAERLQGLTGFGLACCNEAIDVVEYLAKQEDIDINIFDYDGDSCFNAPVLGYENEEVVDTIMRERKDMSGATLRCIWCLRLQDHPDDITPFDCEEKECPFLDRLLEDIKKMDDLNNSCGGQWMSTLLFGACESGYVDLVKILLEKGVNVNSPDDATPSPLHAACLCGYSSIVELLLERKDIDIGFTMTSDSREINNCNCYFYERDALVYTCQCESRKRESKNESRNGSMECLRLLLNHERRSELNAIGAFCVACEYEYLDKANAIHNSGLIDVNDFDEKTGLNALQSLPLYTRVEDSVLFLLKLGANPLIKNREGKNAYDIWRSNSGVRNRDEIEKVITFVEDFRRAKRT